MESHRYPYTLNDLLCLTRFKQLFESGGGDDIIKAIVEWAEQEVMAGSENESLLILASLNLDKTPDVYEVYNYLERFMREQGIGYPGDQLSALTWLRIRLWEMTHCTDAQMAEVYLSYFATHFYDDTTDFFSRTCSFLYRFYYFLFDSYGDQYRTPAEEMTRDELLAYIKERVSGFERKLCNKEWLEFLTMKKVSGGSKSEG